MILGVGGGSIMDCCKAISMAAVYPGDVWESFWARPGVMDFTPLPLGVIVTVAGTGSEMNGGAVITNTEQKVKTGRDYPACNPRFALMEPAYTMTVPKRQTASGGFDVLIHIMETYFSAPDEENVSNDISEALMRDVIRDLRAVMQNPADPTARSNLMWEASMAENRLIKLGKQCDFQCHQMEHQLGAYTGCNHGEGLAVLHPAYYRRICRDGLPNSSGLRCVSGGSPLPERPMKSLPWPGYRLWQTLSGKSAIRPGRSGVTLPMGRPPWAGRGVCTGGLPHGALSQRQKRAIRRLSPAPVSAGTCPWPETAEASVSGRPDGPEAAGGAKAPGISSEGIPPPAAKAEPNISADKQ